MSFENRAPGWLGILARWTSSAKSGVGTALQPQSRVWFTLSHGILNEIYYPRIDQACTRTTGRDDERMRRSEAVLWGLGGDREGRF